MNALSMRGYFVIAMSLLLTLILSVIPLPARLSIFQPQWAPLVIIFWVIALPHRISVGTAWIIGLLLDGLYGSVLGEHALALAVVAYCAEKFYRQIRMFDLIQQALCILLFILIYQALILWIQGMLGELGNLRWFWISTLISMLLWPWIYTAMRFFQKWAGIYY